MSQNIEDFQDIDPERFEDLLSAVSAGAAAAARPSGSAAARARGQRRGTRRRMAMAAFPVALAAVGAVVGYHLAGNGSGPAPLPAASATAPATTGPAPSASATGTAAASTPPTLSLNLPSALAEGALTQVSFTVDNPGAARAVTVSVDLGTPTAATPYATAPNEVAVAEQLDPTSGAWVSVPVQYQAVAVGPSADVATFALNLPAAGSVTQSLRIIPVGATDVYLGVRLGAADRAGGSGSQLVTESRDLPLVRPSFTAIGPGAVTTGTTSGEFDFTLTDSTTGSYSGVQLYLNAAGSTSDCSFNPFPTAQWSDGGAWRTVSLATAWPLLDTVSLTPGQSVVVKVKLPVPATAPACLARGQVGIIAETPGADNAIQTGTPGNTQPPALNLLTDSPFFNVLHG